MLRLVLTQQIRNEPCNKVDLHVLDEATDINSHLNQSVFQSLRLTYYRTGVQQDCL